VIVRDEQGLLHTADLVHCKILRLAGPQKYVQFFVLRVRYPHEAPRWLIFQNAGDGGVPQARLPLEGTTTFVTAVRTDDWEDTIDLEADGLIQAGYFFYSEYSEAANVEPHQALLDAAGLTPVTPDDASTSVDELLTGVAAAVHDAASQVNKEIAAGYVAAALRTREQLVGIINATQRVTADADGRRQAVDAAIGKGLRGE
jgi:hypothetical protein